MSDSRALRTADGLGRVLLALLVTAAASAPARADLLSAASAYKRADYPHAFQEFLALAELGQPRAQLAVAEMYHAGQGTDWSDIHAYAWATAAATNGETAAKELADQIRPQLAPGSERIAEWLIRPYTHAALERTLLPDLTPGSAHGPPAPQSDSMTDCNRKGVRMDIGVYPMAARRAGVEGTVLVEFTLMPDGHARFPRVVFAVPTGFFETVVKESVLRGRFSLAPPGSPPVQCSMPFNFTLSPSAQLRSIDDYERELGISPKLDAQAKAGDPDAQLIYGLLLDGEPVTEERWIAARRHAAPPLRIGVGGLPWLVKAAQAGLAVAQYEVAHALLLGRGCQRDPDKALRWLRMAADQGQPNAEITVATRLLHGTPEATQVAEAISRLERAAGEGAEDGSQDAQLLLAAILAATPQPTLRDPGRALELLNKLDIYDGDPTPLEIRAAAQAAEGDFDAAIRSERNAISSARWLGWNLSPLQRRLSLYAAHQPWYGSLLEF